MSEEEQPLTPSEVWSAIIALPWPSRTVPFPRNKPDGTPVGELAIKVLTQEEQMACAANADRFAKKLLKETPKTDEASLGYEDVYKNAAACEVLFRCCRQKDDVKRPLFPAVDAIRRNLSADEIGVLMNHYFSVRYELGPIVAKMTEEEMDLWVKKLIEGGSKFPLDSLSSEAANQLLLFLGSHRYSSLTATSSPGSPLPEPETTT